MNQRKQFKKYVIEKRTEFFSHMTARPLDPESRRPVCVAVALVLVMAAVLVAAGCMGLNGNGKYSDISVSSDVSETGYSLDATGTTTGKNWTLAAADAAFSPRIYFSTVVFNGRMWVIGGFDDEKGFRNDVWYSPDGKDWVQANSSLDFLNHRVGQSATVFRNKIWIIGGGWGDENYGDIWCSDDGVAWRRVKSMAEFGTRSQHSTVVFNNRLWIIGGKRHSADSQLLGDAWYSDDGVSWTQATPQVAFRPMGYQNLLVLDNKVWDVGNVFYRPENGSTVEYNEIWNSVNGRDWNLVTSHGLFPARNSASAVVYNNKLWIIGGYNETLGRLADVWYSSDGSEWIQATPAAEFSINKTDAFRTTAVVFDHKMWVIQPNRKGNSFKDDVWYSTEEPVASVKTYVTR